MKEKSWNLALLSWWAVSGPKTNQSCIATTDWAIHDKPSAIEFDSRRVERCHGMMVAGRHLGRLSDSTASSHRELGGWRILPWERTTASRMLGITDQLLRPRAWGQERRRSAGRWGSQLATCSTSEVSKLYQPRPSIQLIKEPPSLGGRGLLSG